MMLTSHELARIFFAGESDEARIVAADAFDEFIKEAVLARNDEAVIHYDTHKDADYAVPTKDHFRPLLYALGASEGETPMVYNNIRNLGSMSMTGYIFGMDE